MYTVYYNYNFLQQENFEKFRPGCTVYEGNENHIDVENVKNNKNYQGLKRDTSVLCFL